MTEVHNGFEVSLSIYINKREKMRWNNYLSRSVETQQNRKSISYRRIFNNVIQAFGQLNQ